MAYPSNGEYDQIRQMLIAVLIMQFLTVIGIFVLLFGTLGT
ncbi:MAG: hypothetical protein ACOYD6_06295 [Limnochordia bacterium]|jgi:hypothetical protein